MVWNLPKSERVLQLSVEVNSWKLRITGTFLTSTRKNLVHPCTYKYHIIIGYRELKCLLTWQEVEHLIKQNTETSIAIFVLPLNKACCVLCIIIIICCIHANNKRLVNSPTFLHIKIENSESFTLHLSQLILITYEEKQSRSIGCKAGLWIRMYAY